MKELCVLTSASSDIFFDLKERYGFNQLTDLTVIDYLTYGQSEWNTQQASTHTFSRAKLAQNLEQARSLKNRFELIVHLLNYSNGERLRVRRYIASSLTVPSISSIWPAANWYEREAFDLFGIHFEEHPDLRRILTDYGFSGYPLRKDFPMMGYHQLIYDHEKGHCIQEAVNVELRVPVPRVVRHQNSKYQGR